MALNMPGSGVNLGARGQSQHSAGRAGAGAKGALQWEGHPGAGLKVHWEGLLHGAGVWT